MMMMMMMMMKEKRTVNADVDVFFTEKHGCNIQQFYQNVNGFPEISSLTLITINISLSALHSICLL